MGDATTPKKNDRRDPLTALALVQRDVEARRLPPDHPALVRLGRPVVAALHKGDVPGVFAAAEEMRAAIGALPEGGYEWTLKPEATPAA